MCIKINIEFICLHRLLPLLTSLSLPPVSFEVVRRNSKVIVRNQVKPTAKKITDLLLSLTNSHVRPHPGLFSVVPFWPLSKCKTFSSIKAECCFYLTNSLMLHMPQSWYYSTHTEIVLFKSLLCCFLRAQRALKTQLLQSEH